MHACMHAYIHTDIQTDIHTYIHTYIIYIVSNTFLYADVCAAFLRPNTLKVFATTANVMLCVWFLMHFFANELDRSTWPSSSLCSHPPGKKGTQHVRHWGLFEQGTNAPTSPGGTTAKGGAADHKTPTERRDKLFVYDAAAVQALNPYGSSQFTDSAPEEVWNMGSLSTSDQSTEARPNRGLEQWPSQFRGNSDKKRRQADASPLANCLATTHSAA